MRISASGSYPKQTEFKELGESMKQTLQSYCIQHDCDDLLCQWHPTRNESLTPETVSYGSKKKAWWLCENGHEWQATIYARTSGGTGCPSCKKGRTWSGTNDLSSYNPLLAKQWHPTKNGDLSPDRVAAGSHKKVWWLCENGHEWQATIKSRSEGCGCPVCTRKAIVVGENDLSTTHPVLSRQWHPTKNGALRPKHVLAGTRRKVWWLCARGHEWQASVCSRTGSGAECPVCTGKTIRAGVNDLATLFPDLAEQWHPVNNDMLVPTMVSPYSNRKVWWLCEKGHAYTAQVSARATSRSGCPYCSGRKVLRGFNDLASTVPEVAAQWHSQLNGALTPEMVTASSHKKVWWECPNGHVWKAVVYSRASTSMRRCGCPVCAGKVKERPRTLYSGAVE